MQLKPAAEICCDEFFVLYLIIPPITKLRVKRGILKLFILDVKIKPAAEISAAGGLCVRLDYSSSLTSERSKHSTARRKPNLKPRR